MAYLNKEAYERKAAYASKIRAKNAEIARKKLTEEQIEVIENLCSIRHKVHSDKDIFWVGEDSNIVNYIIDTPSVIAEADLPKMFFSKKLSNALMFCPNYDEYKDEIKDKDIADDDDACNDLYDKMRLECNEALELWNSYIERYLRKIDRLYRTQYCPSRLSRKA